jgi:dipeptidyl aminopeptidase/acylaminoacyl peptidase
MFTALQRQRVPSRLVVFPDEDHWVLRPANSVRWYAEVIDWLDRWTRK